jgi:hypothetical protein
MPIDTAAFRVPAGEKVKLARRPTQVPAFYRTRPTTRTCWPSMCAAWPSGRTCSTRTTATPCC